MRERRNHRRGAPAESFAGLLGTRLRSSFVDRPVDTFAVLAAVAATFIILVIALFLQNGARPAPFVANPTLAKTEAAEVRRPGPRIIDMIPTHTTVAPPPAQSVPVPAPSPRRNDPIADLIGPSPRIQVVQRVLSDYGYGQIKPSGMLDDATSEAIEKFEREHKLPVTGRVSDRLVAELTAMVGHPIQ